MSPPDWDFFHDKGCIIKTLIQKTVYNIGIDIESLKILLFPTKLYGKQILLMNIFMVHPLLLAKVTKCLVLTCMKKWKETKQYCDWVDGAQWPIK